MSHYLQGFHPCRTSERCLNATFLVLILKNGWVEDIGDFRSINLVIVIGFGLRKSMRNWLESIIMLSWKVARFGCCSHC